MCDFDALFNITRDHTKSSQYEGFITSDGDKLGIMALKMI